MTVTEGGRVRAIRRAFSFALLCLGVVGLVFGCAGGGGGGGGASRAFQVVAVTPSVGATEIDVDGELSVEFSAPVDVASITSDRFELWGAWSGPWGVTSVAVPLRASVVADATRVILRPEWPLMYGVTYTAVVRSTVAAQDGSTLGVNYEWPFVTDAPNILIGAAPSNGNSAYTVEMTGEELHVLEATAGRLPNEYDTSWLSSVSITPYVAVGETKVVGGDQLNNQLFSDFVVDGTLVITGTADVNMRVNRAFVVRGRVEAETPGWVWNVDASHVVVSGVIDFSARTPKGDAGSVEFRPSGDMSGVVLSGALLLRASEGRSGTFVATKVREDIVVGGLIDCRSLRGDANTIVLQSLTTSSSGRVILRGRGIGARGMSGTVPGDGGHLVVNMTSKIVIDEGVRVDVRGGSSAAAGGGKGGSIALAGLRQDSVEQLDEIQFFGDLLASGGGGVTPGDGGTVVLNEDPYAILGGGTLYTPDNSDWTTSVIAGRVEAEGANAQVIFNALDPSATLAAFSVSSTAEILVPDGNITRAPQTTVDVDSSATVVDSADNDGDGSPIDVR